MKKLVCLFIMSLLFSIGSVLEAQAQNKSSKEQKKEVKKEQKEAVFQSEMSAMEAKIRSKRFEFIATDLLSSGNAKVSNIKLRSLWMIQVTPSNLRCYLPIYGTASPIGQPTLLRHLDVNDEKYEMTYKEGKKSISVTLRSRVNKQNQNYKFDLSISPTGENSTLTVSSDFSTPATFRGYIK
ncbi:MAG: DUF4251 domain-containing protein [Rikenellaceae bacterium]